MSSYNPRRVYVRSDRTFYMGMALALTFGVFVGFAPTYYLRTFYKGTALSPLVHVHGLAFTSWMLLLIVQTMLVAGRRVDLHRLLGGLGIMLASAMVVLGLLTARASAQRAGGAGSVDALKFLIIPVGAMAVFATLVAAAFYFRRQPEVHKRLMLVATLALFDAAVGRWPIPILQTQPIAFFAATDLFLLAGIAYDFFSRGRVHVAYWWGGGLLVASQVLRVLLGGTWLWLAVAARLVG